MTIYKVCSEDVSLRYNYRVMKNVICVYKPVGLTPLQAITKLKDLYPEYKGVKISYAGRLDPMAEGLLLLLVGDENKKRKNYENLKKTYEFTVLLGIETDTYDMLGIIQNTQSRLSRDQISRYSDISDFQSIQSIQNILKSFIGKNLQAYPPYSSKTVRGKPLYWWARNNRLNEIQIPSRGVEIIDIQMLSVSKISIQELRFMIQERINKVRGDFRQDEILKTWEIFFNNLAIQQSNNFPVVNCTVACSSGTYVRSICHEIGQKLGTGAIALEIKRIQIGKYTLNETINI